MHDDILETLNAVHMGKNKDIWIQLINERGKKKQYPTSRSQDLPAQVM